MFFLSAVSVQDLPPMVMLRFDPDVRVVFVFVCFCAFESLIALSQVSQALSREQYSGSQEVFWTHAHAF